MKRRVNFKKNSKIIKSVEGYIIGQSCEQLTYLSDIEKLKLKEFLGLSNIKKEDVTQVIVGNKLHPNFSGPLEINNVDWRDQVGLPELDLKDISNFGTFTQYLPKKWFKGLKEGDIIKIYLPKCKCVLNLTIMQHNNPLERFNYVKWPENIK